MANSNTTELFEALTLLAKEKGIDPAVLIEKIQTALVIAIKKEYPRSENIKFDIDIAKCKFDVAIQKEVAQRSRMMQTRSRWRRQRPTPAESWNTAIL